MSKPLYFFLFSFILLSPSILAGEYKAINTVPNNPGGIRFDKEIGIPYTLQIMKTINLFIWKVFKQEIEDQRKQVPLVTVNITVLKSENMGEVGENNVYINANSIKQFFPEGQAKFWFASLLYHEMTHVFQWSGNGTAPGGLTEGIADYVMVKSNYYDPKNYDKPGSGSKWDEGYGVTARFLEYCDSLRDGFTADLNNMMREVYKEDYFKHLLGKPLDQVWREYKAKYATS